MERPGFSLRWFWLHRAILALPFLAVPWLAMACSARQTATPGGSNEDVDGSAEAGPPVGTNSELCEHYEKCATTSVGVLDGGRIDGGFGKANAASGASGEACNQAREALFQKAPAANCGCIYSNECPGSTCDAQTGECADSPRVVCKAYCTSATYVDSCTPESCTKFCGDFLPVAKEKCKSELAAFLSCAGTKGILGARCATYILAPSFPVPTACDAEYKAVADCVY